MASFSYKLIGTLTLCPLLIFSVNAQLSVNFYGKRCPNLLTIVRSVMSQAIQKEARMGASVLRLFFHDCFVNGCDGGILLDNTLTFTGEKGAGPNVNSARGFDVIDAIKIHVEASCKATVSCADILALASRDGVNLGCDGGILLDDTLTFTGEKGAGPNVNSARGFDVIDAIKIHVEASCKATVSCADILALASRDGVNLLGGPTWNVPLGRRDARTASLSGANSNLPGPGSSLSTLITMFSVKGLNAREMIALSGAHTIGQARCLFFRDRIFNEKNVNTSFATVRKLTCPQAGGDNNLAPLDVQSPTTFDNAYYVDLVNQKGLFHSDQELLNHGSQDKLVKKYSTNSSLFASDFTKAMVKLGRITPLTGKNGEIRLSCRKMN